MDVFIDVSTLIIRSSVLMNINFINILEENPIIAAIKDERDLSNVLESDIKIVFILTSNVLTIRETIDKLKEKGKLVFVHVDLVDGLSSKSIAVQYLIENTKLDGIISTKHNVIKYAKQKGKFAIQRFFILDSLSLSNSLKYAKENRPDAIEILPGLMPKIIKKMSDDLNIPIIAGGLIADKSDVISALNSGACGISSTNKRIWSL